MTPPEPGQHHTNPPDDDRSGHDADNAAETSLDQSGDTDGEWLAPDTTLEHRVRRLHRTLTALTQHVQWMSNRLDQLVDRVDALDNTTHDETDPHQDQPAPWTLYSSPAAAEDTRHRADNLDPRFTLDNFVAWYNTIYIGLPGTRAVPIPDCWTEHPALAMEIATLTYTWREANIGPGANPRDAQQWHDRWLPGFTERLTTQWTHPHCRDANHRPAGAPSRPNRFSQHTPTSQPGMHTTGSSAPEQR